MIQNEDRWVDLESVMLPDIKNPGFECDVLHRRIWNKHEIESKKSFVAAEQQKTTDIAKFGAYLLRRRTGERIDITKDTFVIGKGKSADYKIRDNKAISREHVVITCESMRFYIKDLDSLNHTYVQGNMLSEKTELYPNSSIRLADEDFVFAVEGNIINDLCGLW